MIIEIDKQFIRTMERRMTPIKAQERLLTNYTHDKVVTFTLFTAVACVFTLLVPVVGGFALPYQPTGVVFGCLVAVPTSLTLLHGVHQRRYQKMQEQE